MNESIGSVADWAGVLVTSIAIFVAAWVALRQTEIQKTQTQIQADILKIEERRDEESALPHVSARAYRSGGRRLLEITNDGGREAVNLKILLDNDEFNKHALKAHRLDVPRSLGSKASIALPFIAPEEARTIAVCITWSSTQGASENYSWESSVFLFPPDR